MGARPVAQAGAGQPPRKRPGMPALLIRLTINLAAPVLTYVLLRPHVQSDITALVIGAAVPAAYTAGVALWRHRLDAIGVFAIVCFGIGLLLVVATGGNELVFKIREDLWTGPLGLACLISVAARRPLLLVILQRVARRNAEIAERLGDPHARRIPTVATGVIGLILLVHAVIVVALALTTSTTTFLALKEPVSLPIVVGGLAALVWWIRRQYQSPRTQHRQGSQGRSDDHVHRHDSQDRHHQRTDRRGVARRAG
jgi:drug/metabolite transporter (DMT)-like permease